MLLLGDAAHVHSAMGGPGLNLGMQDAVNLGWKLAAVVNGMGPAGLLDTYESERYPVGERVMMHSLAQLALVAPGPEVGALRELFGELARQPEVAGHMAGLLAGSDVRYDVGDDHPLSGLMVPDLDSTTAAASPTCCTRRARCCSTCRVAPPRGRSDWSDRVDVVAGPMADRPPPRC